MPTLAPLVLSKERGASTKASAIGASDRTRRGAAFFEGSEEPAWWKSRRQREELVGVATAGRGEGASFSLTDKASLRAGGEAGPSAAATPLSWRGGRVSRFFFLRSLRSAVSDEVCF